MFPTIRTPFTLGEVARIMRRSSRSPRIVAVHHNACRALKQGACSCDVEYRIVKAGRR